MGKYPLYSDYKRSGIPWFGDIPRHWKIARLKWSVVGCKNGVWGEEPDGEDDIVCIRVADFNRTNFTVSTSNLTLRAIKPRERRERLLSKGDLLIEKSGGGEQQLVGAVVQYNHDFEAVTSNFVARMALAKGIDGRFLTYVHAHLYASQVNYRSIKQTTGIQNLDSQQYLNECIAYPPLNEQQAIARFLDRKAAQIDSLIAKKEALLAKLAEKRTALISQAVTRGPDPNVPMKDSGVSWLGQIPVNWEIKRLRFLLEINPSKREVRLPEEAQVSFIPMEAVGEYGGLSLEVQKSLDDIGSGYTYFADNDVVVAKITPCFENGKGALAQGLTNGVAFGTTELHVLRAGPDMDAEFLFYLTISHGFRSFGESEMYGAGGQKRVPESFVKDFRIALPSLNEQRIIANYLKKQLARIDLQKANVQNVIAKLREYRSALITAAVTGKIDVRCSAEASPTISPEMEAEYA